MENVEQAIQNTLRDIAEVDTFLRRLNDRKATLLTKYDKLKEKKIMFKSLELSSKNWDKGPSFLF